MGERRKWRPLRRLLRVVAGFVLFFIAASFVFDHFVQFRMSDKELTAYFNEHQVTDAVIRYYEAGGRKIRYLQVGAGKPATLLLIHGAPSSLSVYKNYYKDSAIRALFTIYAVDRPGYGYSGFGYPEPSVARQAAAIRPVLDSLHKAKHPIIVMGGSYGSTIACRLAMDYPHLVDGLVLVGPSLQPGKETFYWFTKAVESPVINWAVPRMFRSANREKIHHREELKKMLPYWKNIRVPVAYLQGEKDELIDTANASFAKAQLVRVPSLDIQVFKNRKHFIAVNEFKAIRAAIIKMYKNLNQKKVGSEYIQ